MKTLGRPLFSFVYFGLLVVLFSCKKDDFVNKSKLDINEKKFFTQNRSSSIKEKAIVNFIKKKNEKDSFIETTIKRIGFPIWNKAIDISIEEKNIGKNEGVQNQNEPDIFLIPFVKEGDSIVNASMIVTTTNTDTGFHYLCDWQYNDEEITGLSPKSVALLIATLDQNVFGERKYKIIDTTTFGTNDSGKYIKYFQPLSINQVSSSTQNNLYYTVSLIYCYNEWTQSDKGQLIGCPPGPTCTDYTLTTKCTTYSYLAYYDDGGGGSGGTGGTGTGGGGGGGGGSTPPDCGTIPTARAVDPCDEGPGWTPEPVVDEPPSALEILANKISLTQSEVSWLHNNPDFSSDLVNFLSNAQTSENPTTQLPWTNENPEALLVAKSTIQVAMLGIIETGFNQTHFNTMTSNLPSPHNQTVYDPMWAVYFSIECINIRAEHPEWSNFRVYLEASLEVVHILLDAAGMVPVIGEIADLANGGIYTIQGDGVNATISFAAAIPGAGWAATTTKYAKKLITAVDGSKRTLKWIKEANGIIKFGERGLLRKVLGLAKGDSRVAHHLIPWEHCANDLVQKAAKGNNAFNMNEILNGIPLTTIQHNGSHALYNQKIKDKLIQLWNSNGQNTMTSNIAEGLVRNLANDIRTWITSHSNQSINNIIL